MLQSIDPGWGDCDLDIRGVYDPPYALHAAFAAATPTPGHVISATLPASPASAPKTDHPLPTSNAPGDPTGSDPSPKDSDSSNQPRPGLSADMPSIAASGSSMTPTPTATSTGPRAAHSSQAGKATQFEAWWLCAIWTCILVLGTLSERRGLREGMIPLYSIVT